MGDKGGMVKTVSTNESLKNSAKFVIIGTGFAGIATAIRLVQEGEKDIIILERKDDVGGVWRDNQYPGCACDVESNLYSLSFEPNPKWNRKFATQPEIYNYLKECVRKYELLKYIRFQHEVIRMDWNDTSGEWRIQTSNGQIRAKIVVGAFGALNEPAYPNIKGIENFKGDSFHSATWPNSFNPKGKRVGVIGTGASAIQFIPEIQPRVTSMTVFQRTPAWVIPKMDGPISEGWRKAYSRFPVVQELSRLKYYLIREFTVLGFRNPKRLKSVEKIALKHMKTSIKDTRLLEKLTPNYKIGCKRILPSNTYYPALAQPNVEVNTNGISEITKDAIVDAKGNRIEVDTIIYGTGFQITDLPFARVIYGREGRSLYEEWRGSPKAYMGTTVAGFPNLFLMQGPNTGLGHSSVILMIESQVNHAIHVIKHMNQNKLDIMEPSPEAQDRFVKTTDISMTGTVWVSGGCSSWYLDKTGRNSTLWPSFTFSFRRLTSKLIVDDYIGRRAVHPSTY